jgi:hypothetical protein
VADPECSADAVVDVPALESPQTRLPVEADATSIKDHI